jgi:hypothetical protein
VIVALESAGDLDEKETDVPSGYGSIVASKMDDCINLQKYGHHDVD